MYLKLKSATKVLTGETNNGEQSNKDSQYLWCSVTNNNDTVGYTAGP